MNNWSIEELKKRISDLEDVLKELEPPYEGEEPYYLGLVNADYNRRLQAYNAERKHWETELAEVKAFLISKEDK